MDSIQRLVFPGPFSLRMETAPAVGQPLGPLEIDFHTRYSLISPGTELALYTGTHVGLSDPANTFAKYPFYPGYAAVGTVIAAGGEVPDFAAGDEIYAIAPHANRTRLTWSPSQPLLPIPQGCPPELAAFTRLAAIAATAAAVATAQPEQNILVLGGGLIGNLAAQTYAMDGAKTAVVEPVAERCALARSCGLTVFTNAAEAGAWLGTAPDIVVEATGVPELTNTALELVRRRGRVVLLGSPRGNLEIRIYQHIHVKGVQLCGAHEALQGLDGLPTRLEISRRMLAAIASGQLRVEPLLTDTIPAAGAADAYARLHERRALGVLLEW